MNSELKIKAMALFNFLSMNHEKNKRIGELSVKDVIEIVEFLTTGGSNAKNQ